VDVLQHGLGFSRRQGTKALFDNFSRPSDSLIQLGSFGCHCNHRITASEGSRNAVPATYSFTKLLNDRRPKGHSGR